MREIGVFRLRWALIAACVASVFSVAEAQPAANRDPVSLQLQAICQADFERWDRNHDGKLDSKEINALIEDSNVRRNQAAAVVSMCYKLPKADGTNVPSLTRAEVMALTADYGTWQTYMRLCKQLAAINRTLFLAADPSIQTLHQGPVGDCYFIGVLGAVVYRDPEAIRKMIKPFPDGSYEVQFPNRKPIHISAPTDSELVMCAPEGNDHGIWTAVIEKAFAQVRREIKEGKTGVEIEDDDASTRDLLGGGGLMGTSVKTFTGHDSKALRVGAIAKKNPTNAANQVDAVLSELGQFPHRIMAVGMVKKPLPAGLVGGHCYGVLQYDASRRVVRLFNPWGNEFTPKGPPGMANGYPTRFGTFEMPLEDFVQVCGRLAHDLGPSDSQSDAPPPGK